MAVTLKILAGSEIPEGQRRDGLEELFEVRDAKGDVRYYESGEEAAHVVAQLHVEDVKAGE